MNKLTINEIKKYELDILIEIDKICRENNINYSLSGGTLLGAVRHKGFIPWDDDMDIMMFREDYNKFLNFCDKNDLNFKILSYSNNKKYSKFFCKAYDYKNTKILNQDKCIDYDMGVYVDIFPIDALGKTYEEAKNNFNKYNFYKRILITKQWKKFFLNDNKSFSRNIIRFVFYILSKLINTNEIFYKIENFYQNINIANTEFVGAVSGVYENKEIFEKIWFEEFIDVEFEGHKFKAIKKYDKYLTQLYGNYMQLPPKEKQKTHHFFDAYYKD